jgi:hypothetical protein
MCKKGITVPFLVIINTNHHGSTTTSTVQEEKEKKKRRKEGKKGRIPVLTKWKGRGRQIRRNEL